MSEILSYLYDFISMVSENKRIMEKIKEIILFGSVAKHSHDEKSDIDLFFNIKEKNKEREIEDEIRKVLKSFQIKSEKTWQLRGIKLPISLIVGSLEDETWKDIKSEIASSGIILYSSYKELPEKTKHFIIFSYSLNNLKRKEKMKFIRNVFGYNIVKNKKEYNQKGIIDGFGGLKLSSNVILIPVAEIQKIKKLFSEYKIKYKIFESWIRI